MEKTFTLNNEPKSIEEILTSMVFVLDQRLHAMVTKTEEQNRILRQMATSLDKMSRKK